MVVRAEEEEEEEGTGDDSTIPLTIARTKSGLAAACG